jgi:hypothetical protein
MQSYVWSWSTCRIRSQKGGSWSSLEVTGRHVVARPVIPLGASGQRVDRVGEGASGRGGAATDPGSVRPVIT